MSVVISVAHPAQLPTAVATAENTLKRSTATLADSLQPMPDIGRRNNSRPTLPAPTSTVAADMDAGTMLAQLAYLKQHSNDLQLETIAISMQTSQEQAKQASDERIDKILAAIKEQAEQRALSRSNFFLGLIGKIAAVVVAVVAAVATVTTFGAAAPLAVLAIAGAAYAVTDLTLDLATEISGDDVRMGTLIAKGVEEAALLAGHAAEKAKEIAQWSAMAIQITVAIVTSVGSGVGLSRAVAQAATMAATKATALVMKAGQFVQRGAQAVQATTGIAGGGLSAVEGISKEVQANLQAEQLELQAFMEKMQMAIQAGHEDMKKLFEDTQLDYQVAVEALSEQQAGKRRLVSV